MDYSLKKDQLVTWIREWFDNFAPQSKAVIGLSGGKDSSVVTALCVEALGKDRVVCVMMPSLIQNDALYSHMLLEFFDGIQAYHVPISLPIAALLGQIGQEGVQPSVNATLELPARIRAATLYTIAQSINGRVANTSNYSKLYIGRPIQYGDLSGDFCPLANLMSRDVIGIGRALGLPDEILERESEDGLSGRTDEENLGFSYDVLDEYIMYGTCEDSNIKQKIDSMYQSDYRRNCHRHMAMANHPKSRS